MRFSGFSDAYRTLFFMLEELILRSPEMLTNSDYLSYQEIGLDLAEELVRTAELRESGKDEWSKESKEVLEIARLLREPIRGR